MEDRVETRGDLLAALQRNWAAAPHPPLSSAELTGAAVSRTGGCSRPDDRDGVVRFIDLRTWKPAGPPVRLGRPIDWSRRCVLARRADARGGSGSGDRTDVHLIDVESPARPPRRVLARPRSRTLGLSDAALAYAPDGRRLAVALATVRRLRRATARPAAARCSTPAADGRSGSARIPHAQGQWEAHVGSSPDGTLLTSAAAGRDPRLGRAAPDASCAAIRSAARSRSRPNGGASPSPATARSTGDPSSAVTVLHLRTGKHRTLADNLPNDHVRRPGLHTATASGSSAARTTARTSGTSTDGDDRRDVQRAPPADPPRRRAGPPGAGPARDQRRHREPLGPGGGRRLGRRFSWGPTDNGCVTNPCSVVAPRGDVDGGQPRRRDHGAGRPAHEAPHPDLPARDGDVAGGISFTPDGRRLATGGNGRERHDLRLGDAAPSWAACATPIPCAWTAISPDGRLLAVQQQARGRRPTRRSRSASCASDRPLFSRTVRFGGRSGELQFSARQPRPVRLGCCEKGSTVIAWDARSGAERFERHPPRTGPDASRSRPTRGRCSSGPRTGSVLSWTRRTGRERAPAIEVTSAGVVPARRLPGRTPARRGATGPVTATLWDLRTHERVGDHFPRSRASSPRSPSSPTAGCSSASTARRSNGRVDRPTLQRFACRVAGARSPARSGAPCCPNQPYRRVCD